MKELSLNILDVTENSVRAQAKNILVSLVEDEKGILTLKIEDDGKGMDEEMLSKVTDPFFTTRTTRSIGLGLPFLSLAASQADGNMTVDSKLGTGTKIKATFNTNSIDFTPIGDMVSTVTTLIMGAPDIDFVYKHITPSGQVALSTKELREVLGEVSLDSPEVICWIKEYLSEQYDNLGGKGNENLS